MQTLAGTRISNEALSDLVKVADLLYFEGPLLSLFRNGASESFLFYWCDNDDKHNRWLVAKSTDADLERYLTQDKPLLPLLKTPKQQFLYVVETDLAGDFNSILITSPETLPADYFPDSDSFYDGEPILTRNALREERVYIDGAWGFDDLARFPSLYSAIYSFVYVTEPTGHLTNFDQFPMRDGFSSVHFFNGLKHKVPIEDRSELKSVRYASPGAIVFRLNPEIAKVVRRIYNAYADASDALWREHDIINKTLRELNLSSEDATAAQLSDEISDYLIRLGRQFSAAFLEGSYDEILKRSANSLLALKVLLAFFRRVAELREYETKGMMKLSSLV